jgi:uncharacterized protein YciI
VTFSGSQTAISPSAPAGYEDFDAHTVVLYRNAPLGEEELVRLRREHHGGHIAFLRELTKDRVLVHGGVFDDGGGFIFVDVTPEEARELAARDPYVVCGLLEPSVHTWRCRPGVMAFEPAWT